MSELGKNIGNLVSGSFGQLILRQKSSETFEIGQLFVVGKDEGDYMICQIKDLLFGSQIPSSALELMAGYRLEREATQLKIYEADLRNYILAHARPLIHVRKNAAGKKELFIPKRMPEFMGPMYAAEEKHFSFFEDPDNPVENPMSVGQVRSGSFVLQTEVKLNAKKVFKHHVLIPATTGRGKSNLVKVMLFNLMETDKIGKLVFDPHNEYYGSATKKGLKDHPNSKEKVLFYTPRKVDGKLDLKFNFKTLRPAHILNSIELSDAQQDALMLYFREDRVNWVENLFTEEPTTGEVKPGTLGVLRRKVGLLLNVFTDDQGNLVIRGIFDSAGYETTAQDILKALLEGKTVIVDTSLFSGALEIFVATIIVEHVFDEYKRLKFDDQLKGKPVISIVLEEAPRLIGEGVGENIFGQIAREGRKFKIGLVAITQLPSLIPREVLANLNTKIILANEMGPERKALMDSAAQDLSDDNNTIKSLDIGEAIVTSNFAKFAIPIKIPKFEDLVKEAQEAAAKHPAPRKASPGFG